MLLLKYQQKTESDNVVYWKTNGKINNDLQSKNRNCLSLSTKAGFFEKVPTDERKTLGASHIWNQAFFFLLHFLFLPFLVIEKIGDWKKLEILVQNQSFWDIVGGATVLLQHLRVATAGEITQQEFWLYDELALLAFYRFTPCTNLPRPLLFMFLHGAVE